jgi:SAM-dependent methyltransferase
MASTTEHDRVAAFGQLAPPSPVDRFGVWLSARAIHRALPSLDGLQVADLGAGYDARFIRSVLERLDSALVVDVALAPELKQHPKVTALEGNLPGVLGEVEDASVDAVLCISVLEHLWQPLETLEEACRILRPGGTCVLNVPTWLGKRFLELSAFRLGLSPAEEMNDHKAYYDPRDLWPLLVRAGFRPQGIRCRRHKFGLNTVAVCRADEP